MKVKPLDEVLAYKNDEVVHRFARDYKITLAESEEIFLETKRWLWLCASEMAAAPNSPVKRIPLLSEARVIDLMWHMFVIFTRDYTNFCHASFGFYLHHQPRLRGESEAWEKRVAEDPQAALAEHRARLREAYELIYDRLGHATLKKWCEEFPKRFPA